MATVNDLLAGCSSYLDSLPAFRYVPPVKLNNERILLIDGDIAAYGAAGNDDLPFGEARRRLFSKLDSFQELTQAAHVVVHLTSRTSHKAWRYLIAQHRPYQGNRLGKSRPKNWEGLREVIERGNHGYKIRLWHDREADDGLALHVARLNSPRLTDKHRFEPENIYLLSRDKDLRMITGCTHMDWMDYNETFVPRNAWRVENELHPDKPFGLYWFFFQLLAGDDVDNIKGVPGIGEHKAELLLAPATSPCSAIEIVAKEYEAAYGELCYVRLWEMASLLWLRDTQECSIHPHTSVMNYLQSDQRDARGLLLKDRVNFIRQQIKEATHGANP